jgi:hypothetical protein
MHPLRAVGAFMLAWGLTVVYMGSHEKDSSYKEIMAQFQFALNPAIGAFLLAL